MKKRLIRDIIIYILFPVLFLNISKISNLITITQITCAVAVIYTIYTKFTEKRTNTTGIMFFAIFIMCTLIKHDLGSDDAYFYNTCILLSIGLMIPVLRIFNKDISIMILKDVLTSLNKNSLAMLRLLKKKSLINEIKRISSIVEANLVLVVLLRMINIIIFYGSQESYLNFIIRFISMAAIGVVIYRVSKLIYMSKDLKGIDKNQKNNDNSKGKIINFNSFK